MESDDEDDTFVTIGTPLEYIDDDEPIKKPVRELQAVGVGTKARPRFHGAFTGGFSAGYFNTVGSKDGFTPSNFTSSKDNKKEYGTQRPEDFMDDEDFGEYGIAPRTIKTSDKYTSEERKRKRDDLVKSATADSILGSNAALMDLIVPERLTVGIKLLRKMGWKEGQGIGPRYKKQKKKNTSEKPQKKVYGCSLPESESSSDDSTIMSDVTFAPRDVNPIKLEAKDNVHGIGYRGLDPRRALPSTHINLFVPPVRNTAGNKGIRGTAFGVGALEEDDDDDIYAVDHMSNYDMTMSEEKDDSFGWTAPRQRKQSNMKTPVGYIGKLLEGFTISNKPLQPRKTFIPPHVPRDFKPVHTFKKLKEPDGAPNPDKEKLNAVSRAAELGETPIFDSVFDLIPKQDKEKLQAIKSNLPTSKNVEESSPQIGTSKVQQKPGMNQNLLSRFTSSSENQRPETSVKPSLFSPSVGHFSPFAKDPDKQKRYDQYICLVKQGRSDAYEEVTQGHMTEWEKEREKEEFVKASKFYKPMSGIMASRFTRAKYNDDDTTIDMPADERGDKNDRNNAAKMKMFGQLTRDSYEWHPDRTLCKRFNIPDPYPGSTVIGVPKVKRDKFSVFNFLTFGGNDSAESSSTAQDAPKALPAPVSSTVESNTEKPESVSFKISSKSSHSLEPSSIFSSLTEEDTKVTPGEDNVDKNKEKDRPCMDLFEAIFGNTDSEDESNEEGKENKSDSSDMKTSPLEGLMGSSKQSDALQHSHKEASFKHPEQGISSKHAELGQHPEQRISSKHAELGQHPEQGISSKHAELGQHPEQGISSKHAELGQHPEQGISSKHAELGQHPEQRISSKHAELGQHPEQGISSKRTELGQHPEQGISSKHAELGQHPEQGISSKHAELGQQPEAFPRHMNSSSKSVPTDSIFSHLFQDGSKDKSQFLPGGPIPMESLSDRLSVNKSYDRIEDRKNEEMFGPALPPKLSDTTKIPATSKSSDNESISIERKRRHKDRHKHKCKKKKSKKSKQKKKHKKESKKYRNTENNGESTEHDDESSTDSESDIPTDRELLHKLRQMSGKEKC